MCIGPFPSSLIDSTSIETINMTATSIYGSVDFSLLPDQLKMLQIKDTNITRISSFKSLKPNMRVLDVSNIQL